MGRLLGYMANRPDGLERAFEAEADLLAGPERTEEERPKAWGVGFYQGGEILHRKRPFLAGESGNTVSSSIPLMLEQYLDSDERLILISGFGVGLSWATSVLERTPLADPQ